MKKKTIAFLMVLVLVFGAAVGGTIAYLTDKTEAVVNTFTVGDINIDLKETPAEYKIVPGTEIAKDPKVTVEAGSEACWLFVKVEEANWPAAKEADGTRKVDYKMADGWTALEGKTGVYYRVVDAATAAAGEEFAVLAGDKVIVSENLTKDEVEAIKAAGAPTLTFTAYACQMGGIADAATAWTKLNPST